MCDLSGHFDLQEKTIKEGDTPIGWTLHKKPTNQKSLLHPSSSHAQKVHESWPMGEIRRFYNRCSSYEKFEEAKRSFIKTLEESFFDKRIIERVRKLDGSRIEAEKAIKMERDKTEDATKARNFLILPYHPKVDRLRLDKVIKKAATEVVMWSNVSMPTVLLGYRSHGTALGSILRACTITRRY